VENVTQGNYANRHRQVIIDGYNIMGVFGSLQEAREGKISFSEARDDFVDVARGTLKDKLVIVFDGKKRQIHTRERKRVKVVFTSEREEADKYINRIARKGDLVFTNDHSLREILETKGAIVFSGGILMVFVFYVLGKGEPISLFHNHNSGA